MEMHVTNVIIIFFSNTFLIFPDYTQPIVNYSLQMLKKKKEKEKHKQNIRLSFQKFYCCCAHKIAILGGK